MPVRPVTAVTVSLARNRVGGRCGRLALAVPAVTVVTGGNAGVGGGGGAAGGNNRFGWADGGDGTAGTGGNAGAGWCWR